MKHHHINPTRMEAPHKGNPLKVSPLPILHLCIKNNNNSLGIGSCKRSLSLLVNNAIQARKPACGRQATIHRSFAKHTVQ
jgi:hypothetical protein